MNDKMINEQQTGKEMKTSGCGLICISYYPIICLQELRETTKHLNEVSGLSSGPGTS